MNIAFLLDKLADTHPERPAILTSDAVVTWRQFRDRTARLAHRLREQEITAGDRVALLCPNRSAFVEALLACAWIGAPVVPINTRLAGPEIAFQLNDAAVSLALCDPTHHSLLESAASDLPAVILDDALGRSLNDGAPAELATVRADHPLGLFYTSGTTGTPKGVILTHNNMLSNSANIAPQLGYSADDVHLHAAPMFHLADLGAFFGHLFAGPGQHVFHSAFNPSETLELIERHGVTTTMLAPTMIGMLLRAPDIAGRDLSSLRLITYGGAPIADTVLRDAMNRFPGDLVQGFGQSEATQTVCYMLGDEHRRAAEDPALLRRCGRPIPGIHVAILDEKDQPVSIGETGEVAVRGATIMAGYWNQPETTEETLRNGWLHTGDVGFLDDEGFLTLVDRKKDMIITGAENVYSPEVENAVASHPAVAECAVIGVPDDTWGERIHAVIQLAPDETATEPELEAHCRTLIAGYKIPRSWSFVTVMPKTAFGKIQKNELRAPWWADRDRAVN